MTAEPLTITSRLPARQRAALEHLLFFNGQQDAIREQIMEVVESFGAPEIVVQGDQLRVRVGDISEVQALYVLEPEEKLVGCGLFVRQDEERFVVLHLVVAPAWSSHGAYASTHVLMRLIRAIREAARRTRGVKVVELLYGRGRVSRIPV